MSKTNGNIISEAIVFLDASHERVFREDVACIEVVLIFVFLLAIIEESILSLRMQTVQANGLVVVHILGISYAGHGLLLARTVSGWKPLSCN